MPEFDRLPALPSTLIANVALILLAACATSGAPTNAGRYAVTRIALPDVQTEDGRASALAIAAVALIGVPYRNGGTDPQSGLDCSGLVGYVYRSALGISMPRNAEAMSRLGIDVSTQALQPGDLLFFNTLDRTYSHVGIYLGQQRFIHAPSSKGSVRIEDMTLPYWINRYDGARRML